MKLTESKPRSQKEPIPTKKKREQLEKLKKIKNQ
jgi:hypothetical protein